MNLMLDDGTGNVDVREWQHDEDTPYQQEKRLAWQEGVYVHVIGTLKSFNNTKHVVAQNIALVEDKNQITYHLLDALRVHLVNTKGSSSSSSSAMSIDTDSAIDVKPNVNTAYRPQEFEFGGDLDKIQSAVLKTIKDFGAAETGISVDDLSQRLNGFAGEPEIRKAIDFLSSEGHVYSTTDDNHYKSCS
eukprot:TRINITY_DN2415_c0_g1_i4.p2 TRINITY_DN2415_c0_g1~~TRINITY_DN2415_c0_g1_i4.p2  ORF type:complete len:189 (+),score=72.65 TRINITY_DN2415_c0_g1_i4:825-1391(+)